MEVKLDKRYPLEVQAQTAWLLLRDLRATAECMPGAAITEEVSPSQYKGTVKVKVGPALAQFGGVVEVLEVDEAGRQMKLRGKGADKTGSAATMDLVATVESDPERSSACVLRGEAAVVISGKFAQFGSRMMVPVADMILGQFVDNFRAKAATMEPAPAAATAGTGASDGTSTAAAASVPPVAVAPVAREINGLSLLWNLIKHWIAGWFGKSAS